MHSHFAHDATSNSIAGSFQQPSTESLAENSVLLKVEGVSKHFGSTQALKDASLTLQAGEVHVLLGENGAGKSTLAKIVAGIHHLDAGSLQVDGKPVNITIQVARRLGIAMVFQELSLVPHLPVVDNLFLGRENRHALAWLRRSQEAERCQQVFEQLEIDIPLDVPVRSLSIAQKQMVEIAKALLQQPRILIMDEPTSTLTEREKQFLFKMLRKLRQSG